MVDNTLEQMRRGGIHDHLGGGFHRYSTDRRWQVPHFEKMLYDNAQLAHVYADAFARIGRPEYQETAEDILTFVLREMTDADGAFYSALDAETDGVEGQFYIWSPEEVASVLGEEDAALFAEVYGVSEPEVFEHGRILHLPRTLDESAGKLGVPLDQLQQRVAAMREKLLEVRGQRPPLPRDDKILTSWNGLMIGAFARAGQLLVRPDYVDVAQRAAHSALLQLTDDDGRLMRTRSGHIARLNAYLDDYAFLVDGLLELHEATGDDQWISAAQRLTDEQIDLFWDDAAGAFFFTSDDHEELLARTKNAYDSVLPSGNSVSVRNLRRLALLTGEERYLTLAQKTLQVFAPQLAEHPGSMPLMALALSEVLATTTPESSDESDAGDSPQTRLVQKPQAGPAAEEPLIVAARTDPRKQNEIVSAKAYLSVNHLPAGGTARVAVVLTIQDKWHINTNPARPDFLIPTELKVASRQKTALAQVHYPKGVQFRMEGIDEPISVYEKQVVLVGMLQVPKSAAGKTEEIDLIIGYQACNDKTCLPPTGLTMRLQVPVAVAGQPVQPINRRLFEPPVGTR